MTCIGRVRGWRRRRRSNEKHVTDPRCVCHRRACMRLHPKTVWAEITPWNQTFMSSLLTLNLRMLCLIYLLCIAGATNIFAAEITHETLSDSSTGQQRRVMVLRGPIIPGDLDRLRDAVLRPHPASGKRTSGLYVDSPGGDVAEALRLGELIRGVGLSVFVMPKGLCASACFFLYLNGVTRFAQGWNPRSDSNSGNVGLHRPYLRSPQNSPDTLDAQSNIMQKVARYLEGKMVPRRLVDAMMTRPSNDIYWLTSTDLDELWDHPPEIEELFIAKCKYSRKDLSEELDAKRSGDQNRWKEVQAKLDRVADCTSDLRAHMLNTGWDKLEKGWVPVNPLEQQSQKALPATSKERKEKIIESAHPGWLALVRTGTFKRWLQAQGPDIARLASSDDPQDAIKLISLHKADVASGN